MLTKAVRLLAVLLSSALPTTTLWAHHSHAPYDTTQLITVTGKITRVEWRNPHMWVEVEVLGENGKTVIWGFEGSSTSSTIQSGISPRWFKVGEKTELVGNPSRVPEKVAPGCPLGQCQALLLGVKHEGKFYGRNPSNATYKQREGY